MLTRPSHLSVPVLLGLTLCLSACAQRPPAASVAAPAHQAEQTAPRPLKLTRAKRPDPACPTPRVDLSSERKEELFRQFEAEMGPAVPASASAESPQAVRCKQASK